MADEPQVIRGIDWRNVLPFTQIFRSFRIAIHPSKLVLALVALLLIYLGGRILDRVWPSSYKAVPGELALFEASRSEALPSTAFNQARNESRIATGKAYERELARIGKPDGDFDDLKWRYLKDRDEEVKLADARYDAATDKYKARQVRDEELLAAYARANQKLRAVKAHFGYGLFATWFDYEMSQVNSLAAGVRSGNWLGDAGVCGSLFRILVTAPMWAARHHTVYFTIFGVWFLAVWSIFGGAVARIAAVHVARDEKISIRQALAFSINKFLSFLSAPLIPLLIVGVVGIVVAAGGLLGNIPLLGPILVGALFFLALAAGFVMTLVLLGTAGGINLMYPTIAVEGSDSFDAISRSFSYLYARPWRLALYSAVAIAYGAICYLFVRFFIYLMLWLTHLFAGLWFFYSADNATPLWTTMWPDPYANGRLVYEIDFLTLSAGQGIGAFLLAFWVYLTIALLGAFAISFYFSANTIIYFLMRNEVDATELDDVYLEQSDEEFTETVTTTQTTVTTGSIDAPPAPVTPAPTEPASEPAPGSESGSTNPPPENAPGT